MKIADYFRKLRYVMMIALVVYFLNLCIATVMVPVMLPWLWRFVGSYMLFAAFGVMFSGRLRILPGFLGIAALVTPVVLYTSGQLQFFSAIHSAGYSIVLLLTLGIGSWRYADEASDKVLVTGFVLLSFCCFLATFYEPLMPLLGEAKVCTLVYGFFAVMTMNRKGWLLATGSRPGYSRIMRWKNRILACLMFAVALIPACFLTPMTLFRALWDLIGRKVKELAEKWGGETPGMVEEIVAENPLAGGMKGNPNVGIMLFVIAMSLLGIGFIAILLSSFIKAGRIRIGKINEDEDFSDEITRTWGKRLRKSKEMPEPQENKERLPMFPGRMTPVRKIRYRYRQLSRKHPEWTVQSTARENLQERAAGLYELARYSTHPVQEADAESFKKETKKH